MSDDPNQLDELQEDQVDISSTKTDEASASSQSAESPKDIEALQQALEKAQQEAAEAKEMALRAQAEAQNVRRRAEQDVEKAHKFGLEKFVGDMLNVADNLERAVESTQDNSGDFSAVAEGVELTLRTLLDALKRHNVEQLDPNGEPFNPEYHQAMSAIENGECEPNTVLNVFQKGYTLHGRLVRPAMVVVSKAPQNNS